jgi:hypothetical protein
VPDYWPGVFTDIRTAIVTAWPEAGVNFETLQAGKRNWDNLIKSGEIVPPWVVIETSELMRERKWGVCNLALSFPCTLFYFAKDSDIGAAATIAAHLRERMYTMQQQLFKPGTPYTTMQVLLENYRIGGSDVDQANYNMQLANVPFSASSVTFTGLVGECLVG